MKRLLLALTVFAACEPAHPKPPTPTPVDPCEGLEALKLSVLPAVVRVNGATNASATGGTGHYTFAIATNASGGQLSGDRFVAGPTPGTDLLVARDECGNAGTAKVEVRAAFSVLPVRARVRPGTKFDIAVTGVVGTASFTAQGALASGGSISSTGKYVAGTGAGLDLILVRDTGSGEQALLQYAVDARATFRALPSKIALPTGSMVPLEVSNGSGVVDWSIASGTGGTLERVNGEAAFRAGTSPGAITVLKGIDHFTKESTTLATRVLIELGRPDRRAQGRRTDAATLVSADFDGDGIADVALGVPENDLSRPGGGAVFIYRGTSSGLPAEPTWTITGKSDTAQLGAVLAAGDLDGDGKADLAVSAPGDDLTIADSGAVYLYTFGSEGPKALRAPLTGLGRGNFGASLAIADVDGDGDNDLIVGSPGADIAPGTGFTARGVIDVFVVQPGQPIADLGAMRLSGVDLAADGATRRFSNVRAGRGLTARDLNGDGRIDLAFLATVNNTLLGGTAVARAVTAIQVHLGRDGSKRFAEEPDLFVLPANTADLDEGTWRLEVVPATQGKPALLAAVADRLDAPNLTAMDGGVGGINTGGALLFDLSAVHATMTGAKPTQLGRFDARARLWGDQASMGAGRGVTVADVDGDGALELVLGAPYASTAGAAIAGKLLVYRLAALAPGAQINLPDTVRAGASRTDTLGTAVTAWNGHVVAFNSRASTTLGDFTGRLDVFSTGANPVGWTVAGSPIPSKPASQGFGSTIEVGAVDGRVHTVVGVPSISGPGLDFSGNEVGAGQALMWSISQPLNPRVLLEGANTPYVRDGGWPAFGGRPVGTDVAMTDFNGDGRSDVIVTAPGFTTPALQADGGLASPDYAQVKAACLKTTAQTPGAALVYLAGADGTWKEGLRVWAPTTIAGCTVPDGGSPAVCARAGLGRAGAAGGFDFDGDGKQDLALTRTNGLEVLPGRAPDDVQLNKPSMSCEVLFTLPALPWTTSVPAALGDLDGDGCDEVSVRYSDGAARQGVVIVFGFDAVGGRCAGHSVASWVRISGDPETGVATMRLGVSTARAGKVMADGKDYVAITADLYPWQGLTQPTVLLIETAELASKRPTSGERLVSILGDLTATPVVPSVVTPGFGKVLIGNLDLTGDGKPDLVVSAPGANINGDGTGAVFVFAGGTLARGPNLPEYVIVGDALERGAFGQDVSALKQGATPGVLGIGAPLSYRTGTANGTAFVLPLDF